MMRLRLGLVELEASVGGTVLMKSSGFLGEEAYGWYALGWLLPPGDEADGRALDDEDDGWGGGGNE